MKRKLVVLNLALLALIAGAVWRLRQQWMEGKARERIFHQRVEPSAGLEPARQQPPQPVTAAGYSAIAQQMLFSSDRDPTVVIEVEAPKPPPPLPVAHGMMNFGDGPLVILSEKSGAPHRGYAPGEKIGEFTLVAVNRDEIVFEWEGQQVKRKLDELIDRSTSQAPASTVESTREAVQSSSPAASSTSSSPSQTTVHAAANPSGFGASMAGEVRACLPGDTSPPGTVREGLRKVVSETPFGRACRWEPVR